MTANARSSPTAADGVEPRAKLSVWRRQSSSVVTVRCGMRTVIMVPLVVDVDEVVVSVDDNRSTSDGVSSRGSPLTTCDDTDDDDADENDDRMEAGSGAIALACCCAVLRRCAMSSKKNGAVSDVMIVSQMCGVAKRRDRASRMSANRRDAEM